MAVKVKQRTHNEYFRTVSLGNRKSCPLCRRKLPAGEDIWSWGQYVRAKWHTVMHFCSGCYEKEVKSHLLSHIGGCGCSVSLVGYGGQKLPEWLTLEEVGGQ